MTKRQLGCLLVGSLLLAGCQSLVPAAETGNVQNQAEPEAVDCDVRMPPAWTRYPAYHQYYPKGEQAFNNALPYDSDPAHANEAADRFIDPWLRSTAIVADDRLDLQVRRSAFTTLITHIRALSAYAARSPKDPRSFDFIRKLFESDIIGAALALYQTNGDTSPLQQVMQEVPLTAEAFDLNGTTSLPMEHVVKRFIIRDGQVAAAVAVLAMRRGDEAAALRAHAAYRAGHTLLIISPRPCVQKVIGIRDAVWWTDQDLKSIADRGLNERLVARIMLDEIGLRLLAPKGSMDRQSRERLRSAMQSVRAVLHEPKLERLLERNSQGL